MESIRAAFVREATRFKSTHDTVDVPSRDQQVIDNAMANATAFHLPQTIAKAVCTAIIIVNTGVPFELCVVSAPGFYLCYASLDMSQFDSFHDEMEGGKCKRQIL